MSDDFKPTAKVVVKEREVVRVEKFAAVTLELSREQADALLALVGRCVTDGVMFGIYEALRDVRGDARYTLAGVDGSRIMPICVKKDN